MGLHQLSEEVLAADGPLLELLHDDVAELKRRALANARRRIRVCAHPNVEDALHEMLIIHVRGTYIPPHKHLGKSESVHVAEGEADVVLFDEVGGVARVIPIGPYGSGRRFFYRLAEPVYHTFLIGSEFLVYHEVTNGPFRREETVFAPWAPDENDERAAVAFQRRLAESLTEMRR